MIEFILTKYNYVVCILLMMMGLYAILAKQNLIKKIIGLNIFQTAVMLFYVSMSKLQGGTAPIIVKGAKDVLYDNPLPQVLMLTAIVVGISVTAVALALVMLIYKSYGTIEEDKILEMNARND